MMFVPSISQDVNDAAPGVIFGLLIIAVMYVAPTGLAGLAGRMTRSITKILRKE
jgi:branched-chain amino acid transport system permease protein